jgi:hypothetical protein
MPPTKFTKRYECAKNARGYNIYRAKPFAFYDDDQAQKIGERLEDLEQLGIDVTPEYIVEHERVDPNSPFYGMFDPNDQAAIKWWLQQARMHLNQLEMVVVEVATEEIENVRATVNVRRPTRTTPQPQERKDTDGANDDGGSNDEDPELARSYVLTSIVMDDADLRRQAIESIIRDMEKFQQKHERMSRVYEIVGVEPVFEAMTEAAEELRAERQAEK